MKEKIYKLIEPAFSWAWWRSWLLIFVGCAIMGSGFVFFVNPYNFVPGGVYGLGIVLHNIFPSIQVGTFGYMFDIPLMITAVLIFGGQFGARTVAAALFTPGFMNILTRLVYPNEEAVQSLDPALLLGGNLDLSGDLLFTAIIGATIIGIGQGIVVRQQATTGGTDIIGMLMQKFLGIKFSTGILIADGAVVISGLLVIGFGLGLDGEAQGGWVLTLYSLINIFVASRVVARVLDGASYDKMLFINSRDHHEEMRHFIIDELGRSATYIKARGMYTGAERELIFLVISRKEVRQVQHKIREIDPGAFVVVTDAYDTFGEGFKPLPSPDEIKAE
ncbi:MAG: YitT family protein [Rikenellaceae bacterium]|nr:YitT family protein [Rikenellaceae bacterium]